MACLLPEPVGLAAKVAHGDFFAGQVAPDGSYDGHAVPEPRLTLHIFHLFMSFSLRDILLLAPTCMLTVTAGYYSQKPLITMGNIYSPGTGVAPSIRCPALTSRRSSINHNRHNESPFQHKLC